MPHQNRHEQQPAAHVEDDRGALRLSSPDVAVRLGAVQDMLRSLDEATVALLRERIGRETDPGVEKEIATGLALAVLDGSDSKARLEAIATLKKASAGCAEQARAFAR